MVNTEPWIDSSQVLSAQSSLTYMQNAAEGRIMAMDHAKKTTRNCSKEMTVYENCNNFIPKDSLDFSLHHQN